VYVCVCVLVCVCVCSCSCVCVCSCSWVWASASAWVGMCVFVCGVCVCQHSSSTSSSREVLVPSRASRRTLPYDPFKRRVRPVCRRGCQNPTQLLLNDSKMTATDCASGHHKRGEMARETRRRRACAWWMAPLLFNWRASRARAKSVGVIPEADAEAQHKVSFDLTSNVCPPVISRCKAAKATSCRKYAVKVHASEQSGHSCLIHIKCAFSNGRPPSARAAQRAQHSHGSGTLGRRRQPQIGFAQSQCIGAQPAATREGIGAVTWSKWRSGRWPEAPVGGAVECAALTSDKS